MPVEGDRFVSAEVNWGVTTQPGNAVQFDLSGNSPVAFSQIVAFSVDNSQCASDVQFLFPDSGFVLNIPAYNEGVYPVFTNALMFYAAATLANVGDRTVFQVLNSQPPPVAIQPSEEMSQASVIGTPMVNGSTVLVASTVSGTLQAFDVNVDATVAGNATVQLIDGNARVLWGRPYVFNATDQNFDTALSGLRLRFFNGLRIVVSNSSFSGVQAVVTANVYFSLP